MASRHRHQPLNLSTGALGACNLGSVADQLFEVGAAGGTVIVVNGHACKIAASPELPAPWRRRGEVADTFPRMATATLTKHRLSGALGEILIDVRSGGRSSPRPAVVVVHGFKGFKDWGMFPPL